uniref:Reverse transcriptase domain-containing protein n=1 Tax=Leptobrachium leishanense TaxID=445787 RepID=A0A8C5M4Y7_9ANUR
MTAPFLHSKSHTMKIFSLNVKGLNIPHKRHSLYTDINSERPDIICLQETHFKHSAFPRLYLPQYTTQFHATSPTKTKGVSILIQNRIAFSLIHKVVDPNGRFIILTCSLNHIVYTIVNVYSPNDSQLPFLNKVFSRMQKSMAGRLVVCGDFNMSLDLPSRASKRVRAARTRNANLLAAHQLFDVWRLLHPGETGHSFFSNAHNVYSRIDYMFVKGDVLTQIRDCYIGPITWSDHAPTILCLVEAYDSGGRAPWRLNESLLSRPEVREEIQNALSNYFRENSSEETSEGVLWQAHKAVVRGILIKWGARLKKQRADHRLSLLHQITIADESHKRLHTEASLAQVTDLRRQLIDLDKLDYTWVSRRLKARCYIYSNKASRMLANKLKAKMGKARIPQIFDGEGQLKHQPRQIAEGFARYYTSLYNLATETDVYQPTLQDIFPFLNSLHLPQLSDNLQDELSRPITSIELTSALKGLPNGKAPGPDGFTAKYYKCFPDLQPHLLKFYQSIFESGQPPREWLAAHIVTIPKTPLPSPHCSQYRPISLLNVDTKLYAKIMANRFAEVLPLLVADDQVGFIKNRQGPDNTLKILTLVDHVVQTSQPTLLLSLDAEKAFDRINWSYLHHVLLKFNFPSALIKAVEGLYTVPTAQVLNAGFTSDPIKISNGTRQGCPLSPLLYALALEPLAQAIRQASEVQGIHIGPTQSKVSLFADDILLTLTEPTSSLPAIHEILDRYGKASYHKINLKKSQALSFAIPQETLLPLQRDYPYDWRKSH